jgi:RimJ/RimL family protein N-acetyltransferase
MSLSAISTKRLRLTPLAPRDLPALIAMHGDPNVMATLGGATWEVNQSAVFLEKMMAHWRAHGFGWWAVRDETNVFVGRGGLRHVIVDGLPEVEIGYGFITAAWGQGYATELAQKALDVAHHHLGLRSVVSFTLPENRASRRVMEKTGLAFERDILHANLPHVLYRWNRFSHTVEL